MYRKKISFDQAHGMHLVWIRREQITGHARLTVHYTDIVSDFSIFLISITQPKTLFYGKFTGKQ
jgi:hypothetical protein